MTMRYLFNLETADPFWQTCLNQALTKMDPAYLNQLYHDTKWLPGHEKIFNAFSLPVHQTHYILLGESPYPRVHSANGYAFWDAAVTDLWSPSGLSKAVNRATSLRNIIKMLLVAANKLEPSATSQTDIAQIDKTHLVKTNQAFFNNFLKKGFLLLNASLVLQSGAVRKEAKAWQPFLRHILEFICHQQPNVQLILLGNIANTTYQLIDHLPIRTWHAEHPYNISFILNPMVLAFFKPLNLLTI